MDLPAAPPELLPESLDDVVELPLFESLEALDVDPELLFLASLISLFPNSATKRLRL
ncbi:MAG: hypothetical protein VX430_08805 [Pseudomonadota bacterium]|nr:hypothetical protein [Pseudomonadota bacterium]